MQGDEEPGEVREIDDGSMGAGADEAAPTEEMGVAEAPEGPAPRRRSRRLVPIAAIVIVLVVVVAGLYVLKVGPFGGNGASSGGTESYAAARTAAQSAASDYKSGSWNTFFAFGIDLAQPAILPFTDVVPTDTFSAGGAACHGALADSGTSSATLEAYGGNVGAGSAPDWLFVDWSSGGHLAFIGVIGGQATVWETFSGAGCTNVTAGFGLLPASGGLIDSSTAVSSAWSDGGGTFVAAHPGGTFIMSAGPTLTASLGWTWAWNLTYATCPVTSTPSPSTTYYQFNTEVNGTNGQVVKGPSSGTTNCASFGLSPPSSIPPPVSCSNCPSLTTALSVASPVYEVASGDWQVALTTVAHTVEVGALTVVVVNATTGQLESQFGTVELTAASGCALADGIVNASLWGAPYLNGCSGSTGASVDLAVGQSLDLASGTPGFGAGDTVRITDLSTYSGSVVATLAPAGTTCTACPALSSVLSVSGNATTGPAGNWGFNVTRAAGVHLGELEVNVLNGTTGLSDDGKFLLVDLQLTASSCTLGQSSLGPSDWLPPIFGGGCSGTTGNGVALSVGQQFLIAPSNTGWGNGDIAVVTAPGVFSGSVTANLVAGPVRALSSVLSLGPGSTGPAGNWGFQITAAASGLTVGGLVFTLVNVSSALGDDSHFASVNLEENSPFCNYATAAPGGSAWSDPSTSACPSGTLGAKAVVTASADLFLIAPNVPNYGSGDVLVVTAPGLYSGSLTITM